MEEDFLSNRLGEDTNQDHKIIVNLDKTNQNLVSSLNTIKTLIQKDTTK